jgi:antitoxin component YwqK of YwqJK toxin-antitoxin module
MARDRYCQPPHFVVAFGLMLAGTAYSVFESIAAEDGTGNFIAPATVKAGEASADPVRRPDLHSLLRTDKEPAEEQPLKPSADSAETADADGTEVIHERFPNRRVKIERHVAQDADGNYFNQGAWRQWDEQGRLVARGEYRDAKRHGKWFRWYDAKQAELFSEPAYRGFERPFGTEVELVAGELHGAWKVFDAKKRPVCTWQFENGERHGQSLWYLPGGQVRQEVNFKHGQMDGDLRQLNAEGKMAVRERYVEGRRLGREVKYHSANKKKSEGEMVFAETYAGMHYDWWTGSAEVVPAAKDRVNHRQGHWTWWYPNGQKQLEGRYENDQPAGKFTWWYSNGQRQLEGEYISGQQNGKFVWWYPAGQKQREGGYAMGVPVDNWRHWTAEGKIVQTEDYRKGDSSLEPAHLDPATTVVDEQPPVNMGAKKSLHR